MYVPVEALYSSLLELPEDRSVGLAVNAAMKALEVENEAIKDALPKTYTRFEYLPPNSICVSCIGSAGIVAINAGKAQTNQQTNTLIPRSENLREFLYFTLKGLKATIENHGATGATMTNLSKGKFEALPLVAAPQSLIEQFHTLVKSMFDAILVLQRKNGNLKQQRDMLLPKLISGQIQL